MRLSEVYFYTTLLDFNQQYVVNILFFGADPKYVSIQILITAMLVYEV